MGALCCSSDSRVVRTLFPDGPQPELLSLDRYGDSLPEWKWKPRDFPGPGAVLFGNVQTAGEFDPSHSRPGLGVLPNFLVFDARKWGPCNAFTFMRTMEEFKIKHALYMEQDSCLIWDGERFRTGGSGHLVWILPQPGPDGGIDVAQYHTGEYLPAEFMAALSG